MSPVAKPSYETPLILSDNPLRREDENPAHFHFEQFAATLARLIADRRTLTPLTIGVSGTWGSGKTTLLRRLQRQLDQTRYLDGRGPLDFVNPHEMPQAKFRACRTVWFNAWKYADEDELLVALIRVIVQTMAEDSLVKKLISKLLDPTYPRRDVVNTVLGWFSIKVGDVGVALNTGDPQPPVLAEKTAVLDLFDQAFDRLLAAWVHGTLDAEKIQPEAGVMVVFIDDLDRCLPGKAIQVLEAIKLFLDKEGCIFVLGADVDLIRDAVASHYEKIQGQKAEDYLEKVIQIRFQLPPVVAETMQEYLIAQAVDGEMLNQWQTLIAAAEINPRRVKAVVNDITLQWAMLVNAGQAVGVQRNDFICWSALMRAAPPAFKKLIIEIDDDPDFRLETVKKALLWGCGLGDEGVRNQFQRFEQDGRRLLKVLKAIGDFSPAFDAHTLDAFIHLTAPPIREVTAAPGEKLIPGTLKVGGLESQVAMARESHSFEKGVGGRAPGYTPIETWAGIQFMCIPAGKFRMGSSENDADAGDDEKPQHTVEIPYEYRIGRYPITNAQFGAFVQATGYKTTAEEKGSAYAWDGQDWKDVKDASWRCPRGLESSIQGKDDYPVVCVSWLDAMEYCQWLNRMYGKEFSHVGQFRLPTEAEWEKAARGELGNLFPWGDEAPDVNRCNFGMSVGNVTAVSQYSPQSDSPYGCADMAGNVWEWTHSAFERYPYKTSDGREKEDERRRVVRGGAFNSYARRVRCAYRYPGVPNSRYDNLGLRVVLSADSSLSDHE